MHIAAKVNLPVQIKPVMFNTSRSKSAELFFSCCGSVAALPALMNYLL
jgi:hypothetical protein